MTVKGELLRSPLFFCILLESQLQQIGGKLGSEPMLQKVYPS